MMKKVLMMSMCSALLLAGCNKTSQQDQVVSKEQKPTKQEATQKQENSCTQIMTAMQKIKKQQNRRLKSN